MPKWTGRDVHGKGAFIMKMATVGLDLARNVLQLHAVDPQGHIVARKQLRRTEVLRYFATLEPCVVGRESCGRSQHWARWLIEMGHQVKLMPAKFVKALVTGNKTLWSSPFLQH